ncbi:MAG: hypothetical protein EOS18_10925 [Mesorhizobium sp.]|nr:MAG: hypothetical protein EOS18_10925 [Mesorhizobium sp.]
MRARAATHGAFQKSIPSSGPMRQARRRSRSRPLPIPGCRWQVRCSSQQGARRWACLISSRASARSSASATMSRSRPPIR